MSSLVLTSQIAEDFRLRLPAEGFKSATFMLGYHSSEDDFPLALRPAFEDADIVFHERIGWTPLDVQGLNEVAAGTLDAPAIQSPLNMRLTELIRNTRSLQAMWDVPRGHTLAEKYVRYYSLAPPPADKAGLDKYYDMTTGRDKLALRTIGLHVDKAVAKGQIVRHPKILFIAGLSHLLLANVFLQNAEAEVTISSPYGEDIAMNAGSEYIRHKLEGNFDIDVQQLVARAAREQQLIREGIRPTHVAAEKAKAELFDIRNISL